MKTFHILNGDCLAESFPKEIDGEKIIWREALISGPVSAINFFENRKAFISESFDGNHEDYQWMVVDEFNKIKNIPEGSEVYFWFEDDLFCQVNLWFLLSNINYENIKIFSVFPQFKNEKDRWKGFGNSSEQDLLDSFQSSIEISKQEIALANELWKAFSNLDLEQLKILSKIKSMVFRKLREIVHLYIEFSEGKLNDKILDIQNSEKDFGKIFQQFSEQFGEFGFGDLQFKLILKNLYDGKLS